MYHVQGSHGNADRYACLLYYLCKYEINPSFLLCVAKSR